MLLGANLSSLMAAHARKDMPFTPNTKMKQLQWDKLPVAATSRTVWSEDPAIQSEREREMLAKLSEMSIWAEMEEDFKAKQLVINLMGVFAMCLAAT